VRASGRCAVAGWRHVAGCLLTGVCSAKGAALADRECGRQARAAQEAMDGATLVDGGKSISVQVSYNPPDGRADPSRRRPRGRRTRARGAAGAERRGRYADDADADPRPDPGRAGRDGTGVREAASSSEDRDGCGPGTNGHAGSGPRPDALQQSDEGGRPQAWADAP